MWSFDFLFDMKNIVLYDLALFILFFTAELEATRTILPDSDEFEEPKTLGLHVNLIISWFTGIPVAHHLEFSKYEMEFEITKKGIK